MMKENNPGGDFEKAITNYRVLLEKEQVLEKKNLLTYELLNSILTNKHMFNNDIYNPEEGKYYILNSRTIYHVWSKEEGKPDYMVILWAYYMDTDEYVGTSLESITKVFLKVNEYIKKNGFYKESDFLDNLLSKEKAEALREAIKDSTNILKGDKQNDANK